ncbi:MAG: transporter, partial [Enterovirga sp.]|nr:transporter [Enterovirga sp.]
MAEGFSSDRRGQVEPASPVFEASTGLVAVAVVAALYFGREVFIPIAVAILLSFVLAIPVRLLQTWGLGRRFPVAVVVLLALGGTLATGAVVVSQLTLLAGDLPRYQWTIRDKISALKETATGHGPLERVADMLEGISNEIKLPARPKTGDAPESVQAPASDRPVKVEVIGQASSPLQTIGAFVSPLVHPLATIGLVTIFTVFILLQRNDLRNRLIRLAGSHDLQRTTAAMNDAAVRLSRFFLMQVLLNALFGIVVGLGLWLIGVPSPVLWGILAAISRFIPYVGVVIAAGFPLLLSAAVDPGWGMLGMTAAFFVTIEFMVGQVVEPLLYGHSTGLSPVAVIVSVTFWTWLWGGIGLLLATPLTVCLVVLGRHVEKMAFLEVMLGDRPPLTAAESFYQRMLAGDAGEGLEQAESFLKDHSLTTYYDEVALNGLALAQLDIGRGALDGERLARIEATISDLIEELDDEEDVVPDTDAKRSGEPKRADGDAELDAVLDRADEKIVGLPVLREDELRPEWRTDMPILCVGGRNELDRAGARMLAQLLGKHGLKARVEGADSLSTGKVQSLDTGSIRMAVVSFLDASSPSHVRYAVRRLRRRLPRAKILVGSWGVDHEGAVALCEAARSDGCASRLAEALQLCIEAARDPAATS